MSLNKIGSIEAIVLVCVVMTNQILLNIPETIIKFCGSSSWLNVIFISIVAILFTFLLYKLFNSFSGKDLLDVCEYTGGKWLKFTVGLAYLGLLTMISGTLCRYFSEFLRFIYFKNTPIIILILIFLVGAVIANRIGFKAITNVNLVIIPIVLVGMLVIFFSTIDSFQIELLFPILGYGINETFFSGLSNIFAFGGIAFLYFLMPVLEKPEKFKKISFIAIIISSIYLFLSVTSLLLVFSFVTDTELTLSIYTLTRKIEYGSFFQRTDAVFILTWILLLLSYLSIVLALCLYIFKKITGINNSKAMTYCFALLILALSLISTNVSIARYIQENIYKYYEIILVFVVSMIILILGNIKFKRKNKGGVKL